MCQWVAWLLALASFILARVIGKPAFEGGRVTFAAATTRIMRLGKMLAMLMVIGIVAGCASATAPENYDDEEYSVNDPFEDINRITFAVNDTIDGVLLSPMANIYVGIVPRWGRERATNMLNNLGEPVNFFNGLLQWELERAATSMLRFTFNSTIGLGGVFDVAEGIGLSRTPEDFGQTLAVWGVGEGPFLVLPLFGPSNPRDTAGMAADWLMDPFTRALREHESWQRSIVRGIDLRSRYIDELAVLKATSIDHYAAMRELYRQHRGNEIRNGKLPSTLPIPSITIWDVMGDEFDQAASDDVVGVDKVSSE